MIGRIFTSSRRRSIKIAIALLSRLSGQGLTHGKYVAYEVVVCPMPLNMVCVDLSDLCHPTQYVESISDVQAPKRQILSSLLIG